MATTLQFEELRPLFLSIRAMLVEFDRVLDVAEKSVRDDERPRLQLLTRDDA